MRLVASGLGMETPQKEAAATTKCTQAGSDVAKHELVVYSTFKSTELTSQRTGEYQSE
jgi:hypothetical protein